MFKKLLCGIKYCSSTILDNDLAKRKLVANHIKPIQDPPFLFPFDWCGTEFEFNYKHSFHSNYQRKKSTNNITIANMSKILSMLDQDLVINESLKIQKCLTAFIQQ